MNRVKTLLHVATGRSIRGVFAGCSSRLGGTFHPWYFGWNTFFFSAERRSFWYFCIINSFLLKDRIKGKIWFLAGKSCAGTAGKPPVQHEFTEPVEVSPYTQGDSVACRSLYRPARPCHHSRQRNAIFNRILVRVNSNGRQRWSGRLRRQPLHRGRNFSSLNSTYLFGNERVQ